MLYKENTFYKETYKDLLLAEAEVILVPLEQLRQNNFVDFLASRRGCRCLLHSHLSYEEEDTCMSYEEDDTCMSCEESHLSYI